MADSGSGHQTAGNRSPAVRRPLSAVRSAARCPRRHEMIEGETMLPLRGDPHSRLVIGLALLYRNAVWLAVTWVPLIIVVALRQIAEHEGIADPPTAIGFVIGLMIGVSF